jgi:hypothetical protein
VEDPPLGVEPEEDVEGAAVVVVVLVLVDELVVLAGVDVLEESPFLVLE